MFTSDGTELGGLIEVISSPNLPVERHGEEQDHRRFIVAGAKGGEPRLASTIEEAEERAHDLAQKSKSGQAIRVFECVVEFQRQKPPVERREIVKK